MAQGWRISVKIGVVKVPLIIGWVKAFIVIPRTVEPRFVIKTSLKLLRDGIVSFNKINDSMDRHLKWNRLEDKVKIPIHVIQIDIKKHFPDRTLIDETGVLLQLQVVLKKVIFDTTAREAALSSFYFRMKQVESFKTDWCTAKGVQLHKYNRNSISDLSWVHCREVLLICISNRSAAMLERHCMKNHDIRKSRFVIREHQSAFYLILKEDRADVLSREGNTAIWTQSPPPPQLPAQTDKTLWKCVRLYCWPITVCCGPAISLKKSSVKSKAQGGTIWPEVMWWDPRIQDRTMWGTGTFKPSQQNEKSQMVGGISH